MTTPALTEVATVACLFFIFLTPLATAGIAFINTGLGRSHSAAHMMMASLSALSIAGLVYFAFGFGWEGFIGGPVHTLTLSGKGWNWIAAEPFFFRKLASDGSPAFLAALLQVFCVGLAAMIPLEAARTAGAFGQAAFQPQFWPAGPIRFLRTGFGEAAGSRNLAPIMASDTGSLMSAGPARFTLWAALRRCPSPGFWALGAGNIPRTAWLPRSPAIMRS